MRQHDIVKDLDDPSCPECYSRLYKSDNLYECKQCEFKIKIESKREWIVSLHTGMPPTKDNECNYDGYKTVIIKRGKDDIIHKRIIFPGCSGKGNLVVVCQVGEHILPFPAPFYIGAGAIPILNLNNV